MRKFPLLLCFCISLFSAHAQQKIISLYDGKAPGSETWNWDEKQMFSPIFNTEIVYNVSRPSMEVFLPPKNKATGTAVVIAPGGGFHTLSINSEGNDAARWLNEKGVAAFVLKYRLVHSLTDDPVKELTAKMADFKKLDEANASVIPLAMADGLAAMKYVRSHAAEFGILPDRIGFMGFSAGGTVAMSVVYNAPADSRPNFVAPIYAYEPAVIGSVIPKEVTPAFVVVASDDQLGLTPSSLSIYNKWQAAKQPTEMHVYEKGGHGFGMHVQRLPSDTWIDRFGEWMKQHGWMELLNKPDWMKQFTSEQLDEMKKKQEEQIKNDWANRGKYADANSKLKPVEANQQRVVFMGNSITEGWGNLDPSFFEGKPYVNRGISGQTTPQMVLRFRPDVIDLKPAVVVILAGTNDIAGNTGPTTLEAIMGNISSMAELAKANNIRVVLSSVIPAFDYPWKPGLQPAEKIVALNKMIKAYAAKNGHVYLDYFTPMADERNGLKAALSEDGVHPNLAGYKVMAPLAEKAIAEALKKK